MGWNLMKWQPPAKATHFHVVVVEGLRRRVVKVRTQTDAEFEARIEAVDPLRRIAIEECQEACIK